MLAEDAAFFAVTLLVGWLGAWMGKKCKLPAGSLIGSMIGVAVFSLATGKAIFFSKMRVVLQIFSGALIGSRIGKEDLQGLKKLVVPALLLILSMLVLNCVFGVVIYRLSDLDMATALFATTPGGANDMSIIAADFDANTGFVAVLQVVRLLLIYTFMPPMIRLFTKRSKAEAVPAECEPSSAAAQIENRPSNIIGMFCAAAAGGVIVYLTGINAGALIGGMIGSAVFCVAHQKQTYPLRLKNVLQIGSGAYIGVKFTWQLVRDLNQLLVPFCIMAVGIFVFTIITAFLIHKLAHIDLPTALISSSPGGISEMVLLTDELGADTTTVGILHTIRLVVVIVLFPYMIEVLLHIANGL